MKEALKIEHGAWYLLLEMKLLPEYLKKYFWDIDFEKMDFDRRRVFILKRILEYGDEKTVAWMFETFKKAEMKNALIKFRGYSRKSANFWAIVLGVPKERVSCLKKHSSEIRRTIWPY